MEDVATVTQNPWFQPFTSNPPRFLSLHFLWNHFWMIFFYTSAPHRQHFVHSWALVWRYDQKSLLPSLFVPSVHWQHPPEARIWTTGVIGGNAADMDKLKRCSSEFEKCWWFRNPKQVVENIWNPVNNRIFTVSYHLVQDFWTIKSVKRNPI